MGPDIQRILVRWPVNLGQLVLCDLRPGRLLICLPRLWVEESEPLAPGWFVSNLSLMKSLSRKLSPKLGWPQMRLPWDVAGFLFSF